MNTLTPIYARKPIASLLAARFLFPAMDMAAMACGSPGRASSVSTVDLSSVGVERARKAAQAAGLAMTIEEADLATWTWPDSEFDVVASIFLHLPPDLRPRIHAQMLGALKPGGLLIIEAFTPAQLQHSSGGPKQLELLYTAEILRKDLIGADVLELLEVEIDLDEGRMHRGRAAVVHGVLRKQ